MKIYRNINKIYYVSVIFTIFISLTIFVHDVYANDLNHNWQLYSVKQILQNDINQALGATSSI